MLHHHIEIWKQSALEVAEQTEPKSDPLEFG
jgi:hypothetical protein